MVEVGKIIDNYFSTVIISVLGTAILTPTERVLLTIYPSFLLLLNMSFY